MSKLKISDLALKKVKPEYALLICIVLIIAIPLFYYKNVFRPIIERNGALSRQIAQRKEDIERAKVGPEALGSLEEEIKQLNPQIEDYQNKLQTKADIPQMLKELNNLAEQLGIKFVSVNPQDRITQPLPETAELLVQIPIKIKLNGGYHEVGKFINNIENLSRFMKVTDLKIEQDPQNIWVHHADLVITSFGLVSR